MDEFHDRLEAARALKIASDAANATAKTAFDRLNVIRDRIALLPNKAICFPHPKHAGGRILFEVARVRGEKDECLMISGGREDELTPEYYELGRECFDAWTEYTRLGGLAIQARKQVEEAIGIAVRVFVEGK